MAETNYTRKGPWEKTVVRGERRERRVTARNACISDDALAYVRSVDRKNLKYDQIL